MTRAEQIQHIEEHKEKFKTYPPARGRSVAQYFSEEKRHDLYWDICGDLCIVPKQQWYPQQGGK